MSEIIIAQNDLDMQGAARERGSLGITYELLCRDFERLEAEAKERRYRLQDLAARLLPEERVSDCARHPVPGEHVELHFDKHAYYSGLAVCGSVWVCPVCAARISTAKREELRAALRIAEYAGLGYFLATFTLQHSRGDSLDDLADSLNTAFGKMKSTRAWRVFAERWGIIGYVAAFETTHGGHGWHPHRHLVMFTAHPLADRELALVQTWLAEHFSAALEKLGRYASTIHGVDVRNKRQAVDYISKWALDSELTGNEHKNGHGETPFQLLARYGDGDKQAGALFVEYATATKGLSQLRWSKGLRETLAALVGVECEQGEELDLVAVAAERLPVPEASEVLTLPAWSLSLEFAWRYVLRARARGRLLTVANTGDFQLVLDFLQSLGYDCAGLFGLQVLEDEQRERTKQALSDGFLIREGRAAVGRGEYEESAASW